MNSELVRIGKVAQLMGVSLSTVKRNAKIPYVMQGTHRYYDLDEVRKVVVIPEQPEQPKAKTFAPNGRELFFCPWLGESFVLQGVALEDFIVDWGTKEQVELLKAKWKDCIPNVYGFTEAQLVERMEARLTELEDETDNLYANEI